MWVNRWSVTPSATSERLIVSDGGNELKLYNLLLVWFISRMDLFSKNQNDILFSFHPTTKCGYFVLFENSKTSRRCAAELLPTKRLINAYAIFFDSSIDKTTSFHFELTIYHIRRRYVAETRQNPNNCSRMPRYRKPASRHRVLLTIESSVCFKARQIVSAA